MGSKGSGREYECVVYGIASNGVDQFVSRVHALSDDGCVKVSDVRVHESVFQRKGSEKGTLGPVGSVQELRVKRILGDQVIKGKQARICASGSTHKISGVTESERVEILQYGLYQKNPNQTLEVGVRSVTRIQVAGQLEDFLQAMGFIKRYETFSRGEKILHRDGVEIELFRLTTSLDGDQYIVPSGHQDVSESPLVVNVRSIAQSEAEIDKTAKRVRSLVNDLLVSPSFEEVKLAMFLPRGSIR